MPSPFLLKQFLLLVLLGGYNMQQFLEMFADIVLYPMSIEVNAFENPLTIIAAGSIFGVGLVVLVRRLLCRI